MYVLSLPKCNIVINGVFHHTNFFTPSSSTSSSSSTTFESIPISKVQMNPKTNLILWIWVCVLSFILKLQKISNCFEDDCVFGSLVIKLFFYKLIFVKSEWNIIWFMIRFTYEKTNWIVNLNVKQKNWE